MGNTGTQDQPVGSGALTLITKQVLVAAAATIDFSGIPQTFNHLLLKVMGATTRASNADICALQINGDAGANYEWDGWSVAAAVAPANDQQAGQTFVRTQFAGGLNGAFPGVAEFEIPAYTLTAFDKAIHMKGGMANGANSSLSAGVGTWHNTVAVNRLTLSNQAQFAIGTAAFLYGVT